MKNLKPKRVTLTSDQKKILEVLSGKKVLLKNTFSLNQAEISNLQTIGLQNSLIYLNRNKIEQNLSIFEENNLFIAVTDLQTKLGLRKLPRSIECYDISHLSGKFVYGSMVVFIDGKPFKKKYKLFKTTERNDDFANHKEVLQRRLKRAFDVEIELKNIPKLSLTKEQKFKQDSWKLPNLMIIDGGKGQLSSDVETLRRWKEEFEQNELIFEVEICALAKREEEIFLLDKDLPVILTGNTLFLVQRIRDEAHRFAITNNRKSRLKTVVKSELDDIPGIGPKTKQKLLITFGSVKNLAEALFTNKELVYECVGQKNTEKLKQHFGVI
jgi:excinuclease ABC subunit C